MLLEGCHKCLLFLGNWNRSRVCTRDRSKKELRVNNYFSVSIRVNRVRTRIATLPVSKTLRIHFPQLRISHLFEQSLNPINSHSKNGHLIRFLFVFTNIAITKYVVISCLGSVNYSVRFRGRLQNYMWLGIVATSSILAVREQKQEEFCDFQLARAM